MEHFGCLADLLCAYCLNVLHGVVDVGHAVPIEKTFPDFIIASPKLEI